jgi:hypothetical protein
MNTSTLKVLVSASGLIWLSAYCASSALALNNETDYPPPLKASTPSKARAEVLSEYLQAAGQGILQRNDLDYPPAMKSIANSKTRADVSAEYAMALRDEIRPINNEFSPSFLAKNAPSNITREEVRAEAMEWLRASRGDVQMGSR